MSDMNLPTVTVDSLANAIRAGASWGSLFGVGVPAGALAEKVLAQFGVTDNLPRALVPVDQVEKVWWCSVERRVFPEPILQCVSEDVTAGLDCGWRFLVSAKEEE